MEERDEVGRLELGPRSEALVRVREDAHGDAVVAVLAAAHLWTEHRRSPTRVRREWVGAHARARGVRSDENCARAWREEWPERGPVHLELRIGRAHDVHAGRARVLQRRRERPRARHAGVGGLSEHDEATHSSRTIRAALQLHARVQQVSSLREAAAAAFSVPRATLRCRPRRRTRRSRSRGRKGSSTPAAAAWPRSASSSTPTRTRRSTSSTKSSSRRRVPRLVRRRRRAPRRSARGARLHA